MKKKLILTLLMIGLFSTVALANDNQGINDKWWETPPMFQEFKLEPMKTHEELTKMVPKPKIPTLDQAQLNDLNNRFNKAVSENFTRHQQSVAERKAQGFFDYDVPKGWWDNIHLDQAEGEKIKGQSESILNKSFGLFNSISSNLDQNAQETDIVCDPLTEEDYIISWLPVFPSRDFFSDPLDVFNFPIFSSWFHQ